MSSMGYTNSKDLTKCIFLSPHSNHPSHFLLKKTINLIQYIKTQMTHFTHNRNNLFPVVLPFSGGHGGEGGGGDGHGGENENEREAMLMLAGVGRKVESLPVDLASAIKEGTTPRSVVKRFLDLEKSGFMRWLMQFEGFKERLLADDLFLAKVRIEFGVGMFTKAQQRCRMGLNLIRAAIGRLHLSLLLVKWGVPV